MARARKRPDRKVVLSNVDKPYFPTGYTKGDMIRYYVAVAPVLLPHLKNRPITLIRFPDGVKGESFYEKNAPRHAPPWIKTFPVPRRHHEGEIDYILVNDVETLAWCANLGAIEFHPFLHRALALTTPTHVAFDLDPGEGADIFTCIEVAERLRGVFEGLGLESFPKVSGSKGVQVYVPLNTPTSYDSTQPFARSVAELLEREQPDLVVSAMSKALRKGKVLIDWSQNSEAKTTVSVYSLRGKREAPYVSMPLTWAELKRAGSTRRLESLNIAPAEALRRVARHGDRFEPVLTLKQRLPEAFRALGQTRPRSTSRTSSAARGGQTKVKDSEPALDRYRRKRDFSITAEPRENGRAGSVGGEPRFVIQKHAARNLHYDFRLEMDGTLKSWAVPKGPPYALGVKRAAFEVEDHPIDYLRFEGTIPKGQYGGGTVMVWDIGTYTLLGGNLAKGDLKLRLEGTKLKGEWHLFRIKNDAKPVWLLAKSKVAARPVSQRQDDRSVLTGRSMAGIARDNDRQWQSNRAEAEPAAAEPEAAPRAGAATTRRRPRGTASRPPKARRRTSRAK